MDQVVDIQIHKRTTMRPAYRPPHQIPPRRIHPVHGARSFAIVGGILLCCCSRGQTPYEAITRWQTYVGGNGDDRVLATATDEFGHVYVAGRTTDGLLLGNDTTEQSGLTHQAVFGGGASDAFVAKFAPHGSMLWCTYFGGPNEEEAVAVVVTGMDGLYLVGNTRSDSGIATDSSLQTVRGGGSDMFIARFTEYGLLLGGTYLGGADDEYATGAALSHLNDLVVCGTSAGAGTFSAYPSPMQDWAGASDGVLAEFHSTDSLINGSYIGGTGDDALVRIVPIDTTGFMLLGNTNSGDGIATAGAMTTAPQGGNDAFLMRIDTDLVVIHGTYFGGAMDDHGSGLAFHGDRIAICGTSWSDTLYTDSTALQAENAGGGDGFLAVLDTTLQLTWCTFIGDTLEEGLAAVAFDELGRLYGAGFARGDTSIAVDSLYAAVVLGPSDAFLFRSDSAQTITWSRCAGAMAEEEANALCVQGNTAIYLGGRTSSSEGFSMLGHQMEFGGGAWDGSLARLDQKESTICTGICTGTSTANGGGGTCSGVSDPLQVFDVCLGQSVSFIVFGGALGSGAEWMWYADECGVPEHFLTMGDTITITPTQSFILYVRAESTDHVTGCQALPIVVHAYPDPVVEVTDTVCIGGMVLMQGSGAESFSWSLADTLLTGEMASLLVDTTGTFVVYVTATNAPGCSVERMDTVMVLPGPAPQWNVSGTTCHDGTDGAIALDTAGSAGLNIAWEPDTYEGAFLEALSPGMYIVTVTDAQGCARTDTLLVLMPPPLIDSVSTVAALCGEAVGGAVIHSGSTSPGLAFDWGDGPTNTLQLDGLLPGVYSVIATDSAGCQEERALIITEVGSISASIGADTVSAENGLTTLNSTVFPADSLAGYLWEPDTGLDDPTAASTMCQVWSPTVYVVTVTSAAGCQGSDSVLVIPVDLPTTIVEPPCGEVFLPNRFSPNGDGLNDALCLMGGCFTAISLNVYDRWGRRIYRSNDPDNCWDGRHDGEALPVGAYAFTLYAERRNGDTVERSGTIKLLR